MKKICLLLAGFFLLQQVGWSQTRKDGREFYRLTIYHYTTDEQEKKLDAYLENALLPALHRMKIKQVGVFKAISNDTSSSKSLYVLLPLPSLDMIGKIEAGLQTDKDYQANGSEYINTLYTSPFYTRIETIITKAFALAPQLQSPQLKAAKRERIYELRSYESASEKIFKNKVHMFNEGGEIVLFKRLGFNAIFYSEVIAGNKMPNLMYMTSFENMADRDAHWKSFSNDAEWKRISAMPEYQHNVSHIDITFLRPADYSDL